MFKRKSKPTFWQKTKTFLRTFYALRLYAKYVFFKLTRSERSNHRIACGLASGIAISVTPFVGFHFVLSISIAIILRGSPIAAAIGTAFGNPVTFPFIWLTIYKTGLWFMPSFKMENTVNFWNFFKSLGGTVLKLDIDKFFDQIYPIFFPMLVGSLPYYIFTFLVSYFLILVALKEFRIARRMISKKHKEFLEKWELEKSENNTEKNK